MGIDNYTANQRIANNTLLLYFRTFFVMLISLYTSRIILIVLGIEDYGVYQVVGGVVGMFSVVSAALTTAIGRFVTYEIGSGDDERLKNIFSTSKVVQLVIVGIVIVLVEIVGVWFLDTHIQLPDGRAKAAMWVLQFSLLSFCIDLVNVPYNACIIAHEHMKAYAYMSVLQALLRLGICFLLVYSPIDRLVFYALLILCVSLLMRFICVVYCRRHFEECNAPFRLYRHLFKEMFSFAGWSFLTNTTYIMNTQGVNMLINVYYGVVYNAARGIANQVESAVLSFVNSFTVAINPQITKCYAAGRMNEMFNLVCRGARFSFYLMLLMALPLICEASTILNIWLTEVPDMSIIFVQLSLINGTLSSLGNTSYTACLSTGRIKKYTIVVSLITMMVFPLTWVIFYFGGPVSSPYVIYIFIWLFVLMARLFLMKELVGFRVIDVIKSVYIPVVKTTLLSVIPSIMVITIMPPSLIRLFVSILVGGGAVASISYFIGMTKTERVVIKSRVSQLFNHFNKYNKR